MDAIMWHKGMACKAVQHGWKVRVWDSKASGQRELMIYPRTVFLPLEGDRDQAPCPWVASDAFDGVDVDLEALERKAERSAQKAAARARLKCRHKIKHASLTQMLTLTYRENMGDLSRMRRDFAAWLRIMRRQIKGFRAVYGFERQDRGAWHVHVACDRLPFLMQYKGCKVQSWKVGTAIWRGIVPTGGMCFVGGRKGRLNRGVSSGKIAAYIAGYLTKDNAAGEGGRRMWDSTQGLTPPPCITMELPPMDIGDAVGLAFELHTGERVLKHLICKSGDMWLLHTERDS
jgi:hypothetical protein